MFYITKKCNEIALEAVYAALSEHKNTWLLEHPDTNDTLYGGMRADELKESMNNKLTWYWKLLCIIILGKVSIDCIEIE